MYKKIKQFFERTDNTVEVIKGILNFIFIFILVFGFIRPFVGAPFRVDGESMMNTLENGDILIVSKINYLLGKPKRGDIAILHPPYDDKIYYVKRIIGTPNDNLNIDNGSVKINNEKIEENYTNGNTYFMQNKDLINIPEDHYFVMGDNRQHSTDSRFWLNNENAILGSINKSRLIGKAILRICMKDTGIKILPQIGNMKAVTLKIPIKLEILHNPKYI